MIDSSATEDTQEVEVFKTPLTSLKPPNGTSFRALLGGSKGRHLKLRQTSPKTKKLVYALKTRAVKQKKKIDAITMKVKRIESERMKFAKALVAAKCVDEKERAEIVRNSNKFEEEKLKVKELSSKLEEETMKVEEEKTQIAELSARHKQEVKSLLVKIDDAKKAFSTLENKTHGNDDKYKKEVSSLKTKMELQKGKILVLTNKVVEVENDNTRLSKELKASIATQEKQLKEFNVSKEHALEENGKLKGTVGELKTSNLKEKGELKTLIRKDQEKIKKLTKLSTNHKSFLNKLRGQIQCPVCREVPRAGKVPVCPNGHFVCRKCKTSSCPTCRVTMGDCMSSLAVAVIENIDHKCKFAACQELFALDKLEDHERVCSHRTVKCPFPHCTEKIALSKLLGHIVSKGCSGDKIPFVVPTDSTGHIRRGFQCTEAGVTNDMYWTSSLFSFDGILFVVFPVKLDGVFYFSLVMLSSESVCSKYKIEMIVHENSTQVHNSEVAYKYSGNPFSIDSDYKLTKHQGLTVDGKSMDQILKKGNNDFSVSFSVLKK